MSSTNARTMDRAHLARQAAARLWAAQCKHSRDDWNLVEAQLEDIDDPTQAQQVAEPLLQICRTCPIATECAIWAELDRYTGVAGAHRWINGRSFL